MALVVVGADDVVSGVVLTGLLLCAAAHRLGYGLITVDRSRRIWIFQFKERPPSDEPLTYEDEEGFVVYHWDARLGRWDHRSTR
jgi:hypothetical protein